jgi:hypothetical protein
MKPTDHQAKGKFLRAVLATALVAGLVPSGWTATNFVADGITWDASFEGNQDPRAISTTNVPRWALLSGGSADPGASFYSSDGDIWTQDTGTSSTHALSFGPAVLKPSGGPYWNWYSSESNHTILVELRLKVNSTASYLTTNNAVGQVRMAPLTEPTGSRTFMFKFGQGWVDLMNADFGTKTANAVFLDNTNSFHTYTIAISNNAAKLFVDGSLTPSISLAVGGGSPGAVKFLWGNHYTSSEGGSFSIDYIRWVNIPEPSAAVLLAGAAIMWMRWRRR